MQYRDIIAVCSEIHVKHINTFCGQNFEIWNVKPFFSQYQCQRGLKRESAAARLLGLQVRFPLGT